MDDVTVGVDIGTTSVKAIAADADGNVVARARVRHALQSPTPTRLQHDAAAAWVDGPRLALAELGVRPRAIAVDAMVPSLAAVGPDGVPITPGLLYGDDRGTPTDVAAPPGQSGEATGFLAWLAKEAPGAHGYWSAQAVANHALGGEAVLDVGSAVSLAPLLADGAWNAPLLAEHGVRPEQLPRVGGLADAAVELDDGTILSSGCPDALGEQLVSGATEPGDVLVMCGTTMMTWALIDEYRVVDRLWTVPHLAAPGVFLIGGPSNAGGMFLDWARNLLAEAPVPAADPANIPVWAPYPRGERTPLHDPSRQASLHDLTLTHGPAEVRRAAYEAAGFVVRHHLDLAGISARRLVVTGGGTRSSEWMQALADCTGVPAVANALPEGAALGAAYVARLAIEGTFDFAGGRAWARLEEPVEPRGEWAGAVAARYTRFRELS